jgi:hypothetical protein
MLWQGVLRVQTDHCMKAVQLLLIVRCKSLAEHSKHCSMLLAYAMLDTMSRECHYSENWTFEN